jgi:hypothetical protein
MNADSLADLVKMAGRLSSTTEPKPEAPQSPHSSTLWSTFCRPRNANRVPAPARSLLKLRWQCRRMVRIIRGSVRLLAGS